MRDARKTQYDLEKCITSYDGEQRIPLDVSANSLQRRRRFRATDWMGLLNDDIPLTMITIPGTHDSAAYTSSVPFVSTQTMDFLEQLNEGIRYFDLRCAVRKDVVEMVHGVSFLGMTLSAVLETMYLWLAVNTTEALIVQIKQDRGNDRSKVDFTEAVIALLSQRSERWRTANDVPLLGALRGRIQLFRRFGTLNAYGLNVTEWKDNPHKPFTMLRPRGIRVTIQDWYTFPKPQPLPSVIKKKGGAVAKHMQLVSRNRDPEHWFMNFTSAYEINLQYQLTPRAIAIGGYHHFKWNDGVNILLRGSLLENRGKRTRLGIVAMDYPEMGTDDLIAALIESNFDLEEDSRWCKGLPLMFCLMLLALILLIVLLGSRLAIWPGVFGGLLRATPFRSIQSSLAHLHPP